MRKGAETTVEEKRRKIVRNRLLAVLAKDPGCLWAQNELKYLDVEPMPALGGICISGMTYKSESDYNGGYVE